MTTADAPETTTADAGEQLPFRVYFDMARGQLVAMMTLGVPPKQRVTNTIIPSPEHAAYEIALHRHEARLRLLLADAVAEGAVRHFGVDAERLDAAVAALSDPASTVPVGQILRGEPPAEG